MVVEREISVCRFKATTKRNFLEICSLLSRTLSSSSGSVVTSEDVSGDTAMTESDSSS